MKLPLLAIAVVSAAALLGSAAAAQDIAPQVTMQPIPNPPAKETAKAPKHKSTKHHKSTKAKTPAAAPAPSAAGTDNSNH